MNKKKYKYTQRVKVTVWQELNFEIEASSREEADEMAKPFIKEDAYRIATDQKYIEETVSVMTPMENDNRHTIELYNDTGRKLGYNY